MLETQEMTVVNPSPKKRGPKPGVRRRRAPERVVAYPESVQARLDTRTFEALNATAARMGYSPPPPSSAALRAPPCAVGERRARAAFARIGETDLRAAAIFGCELQSLIRAHGP